MILTTFLCSLCNWPHSGNRDSYDKCRQKMSLENPRMKQRDFHLQCDHIQCFSYRTFPHCVKWALSPWEHSLFTSGGHPGTQTMSPTLIMNIYTYTYSDSYTYAYTNFTVVLRGNCSNILRFYNFVPFKYLFLTFTSKMKMKSSSLSVSTWLRVDTCRQSLTEKH